MPSTMRGKVCRTRKDFVTLWTPIFNMDDASTAVSGQFESVFIFFLTKSTEIGTDFIFYFAQLFPRFVCHFNSVKCRVNVSTSGDLESLRKFGYDLTIDSFIKISNIQISVYISTWIPRGVSSYFSSWFESNS